MHILPWRGVTLVGTTHVDSGTGFDGLCIASAEEVTYLLDGVRTLFTGLDLEPGDIQAAFAGYRPIADKRTADPAHASRDYDIWIEDGLITVAGGKLTTHRSVARHVMRAITPRLLRWNGTHPSEHALCASSVRVTNFDLPAAEQLRLTSHFGPEAVPSILAMSEAERHLEPELPGFTLAELRWAARAESVEHLDDLLSRRVRLALLLPEGGKDRLGSIEPIVRQELDWDRNRWQQEVQQYLAGWAKRYAVPPIPGASASRPDARLSDRAA
jgi:glycerol-3-phosphate dehydrogenase